MENGSCLPLKISRSRWNVRFSNLSTRANHEQSRSRNIQAGPPIHANAKRHQRHGTIFGGVILSWIDQAGFVEARRHAKCRWVTASIERVDFRAPVKVGDLVRLLTRPCRTGTSSLEVEVRVEAERWDDGETAEVTTARLTMVAVDEEGRPFPWNEA